MLKDQSTIQGITQHLNIVTSGTPEGEGLPVTRKSNLKFPRDIGTTGYVNESCTEYIGPSLTRSE